MWCTISFPTPLYQHPQKFKIIFEWKNFWTTACWNHSYKGVYFSAYLMCGDCGDCSAALICPKICSRAAVIVVMVVDRRQTTEIASLSSQLKLHRNQLTQTHSEICKLVWCLQDPATPFPWSSSCWAGIASKQNRGCPGGTVFTEHGISNPLSMARLELGWTRDKPLFCKLYSDYLHFTGTGTLSSDRL